MKFKFRKAAAGVLEALALASALGAATPSFGQTLSMTGTFGGGFGPPNNFTYTQITLENETHLTGSISQPWDRVDEPPLESVERDGSHLRFMADSIAFDLRRTDFGFEGTVQPPGGSAQPAYFAIRPGAPPASLSMRFEGIYDIGDGRTLSLARNTAGGSLWYQELPSGRTGFLFNTSNEEFIAGPCLYCVGPIRMHLRLLPASGRDLPIASR